MVIDVESLERATLDAVAPNAVGALPGWLLPFDTTTVGRAISAVPVHHANPNPALIPAIEACYAERGLRAQFRLADVPGTAGLRQKLLQAGYLPSQPTWTMVGTVSQWPTHSTRTVHCAGQSSAGWQSVYMSADFDPVDGANRVRALSRSNHLVYAWLEDATGAIAAGTAAFSHGWASLHGLRTVVRERGKGCARDLIAALGQFAREKEIERCFLQVEDGNAPAISLYQNLGFESAWLYHYWHKQA